MHASFSGRLPTGAAPLCTPRRLPLQVPRCRTPAQLFAKNSTSHKAVKPLLGLGRHKVKPQQSIYLPRATKDEDESVKYNKEFGYSRKDVILIGAGLIGAGYVLYYGAQAVGIEATTAGNYVQLLVLLVICVGYISTYIFRVANKDMTYARQLEQYEERVMQKRLEEMPETERERLIEEVEREKERRQSPGS